MKRILNIKKYFNLNNLTFNDASNILLVSLLFLFQALITPHELFQIMNGMIAVILAIISLLIIKKNIK